METLVEVQPNGAVVLPATLRKQYQIQPGDRLRLLDIDGVLILAQQKEPMVASQEQRIKDFEAEIAHFERLKPQLLQQHPERFVAIYQGEVVAVGDNKMDVLSAVQATFGNVAAYIGQVTERGLRRVRVPSAYITR